MTSKTHDLPFLYVNTFDSASIGKLDNITQQMVINQPFHLRRAIWMASMQPDRLNNWSSLQVYDRNGRSLTGPLGQPDFAPSEPLPGHIMLINEFVFAPESVYMPGDTIRYDMSAYPVSLLSPAPLRPIVFQGVHRFPEPINAPPVRKGNYFERPYQYSLTVSLTVAGDAAYMSAQQNYSIEIRDYDFEVRRILIVDQSKSQSDLTTGTEGYSTGGMFAYTIQNPYSQALSNAPVPDWALAANTRFFSNCFPVPGLIYPIGSLIRVQATNIWAQDGDPATRTCTQQLIFDGVQRFPCA